MKKTLSIFLALAISMWGSYLFFEPQVIKGAYDDFTVSQEVTGEISIDCSEPVNMSPSIPGMTGGTGTGTSTCTITTSDVDGYSAYLSASTSPALKSGAYSFDDYDYTANNATNSPEFNWSILSTASEFGYTIEGNDTHQFFKDNGSICNAGSANAPYKCWHNASTTNQIIADRSSPATSGINTVIGFRAEVGTSRNQESGTYTATIGVTANVK